MSFLRERHLELTIVCHEKTVVRELDSHSKKERSKAKKKMFRQGGPMAWRKTATDLI